MHACRRHMAIRYGLFPLTLKMHSAPRRLIEGSFIWLKIPLRRYAFPGCGFAIPVRCAWCWQGPSAAQSVRYWLASPCSDPLLHTPAGQFRGPRPIPVGCAIHDGSAALHASHCMFDFRGFFFCDAFGAFAAKCVCGLANVCSVSAGLPFIVFLQSRIRTRRFFHAYHSYSIHQHLRDEHVTHDPLQWPAILAEAFSSKREAGLSQMSFEFNHC